jgi:SAM-dependent methyltransferase
VSNFGSEYAILYDLFHENKNYKKEIEELLSLLNYPDPSSSILDFGCGSGKHLHELSKMGFQVDGYDKSKEMIILAKKRLPNARLTSSLKEFKQRYAIVYSLFDVMSYQNSHLELEQYFNEISTLVEPHGIVVVDGWSQSGLKLSPPVMTNRSVIWQNRRIERRVKPVSSKIEDIYNLEISLWDEDKDLEIACELHSLRAWSLEEVIKVCAQNKLELLDTFVPSQPMKNLELSDWRFGVVLRSLAN